ncbi:MAG: apolipoprotein N-acyltransferase [Trueperaceae bacterium]
MFGLQLVLMLVCGTVLSLAMPPTGFWFCFLVLIPLFIAVASSERSKGAFWLGFALAVGFFALHLVWLPSSLSKDFGALIWATFPPLVLLLACFWGIVTFISRWLGGRGIGTLLLLPPFWLLMEWARTHGTFAFPWGSLGYLWLGTPLAQAAELGGSYGLSLLTLIVAVLFAAPFTRSRERIMFFSLSSRRQRRRGWLGVPVAVALLATVWVYGLFRLELPLPELDRSVLLVQGNTDPLGRMQGTSSDVEIYTSLTRNAMTTLPSPPDLVVWPEGAVIGKAAENGMEGEEGKPLRELLQNSAGDTTLITGISISEWQGDVSIGYNRVYSLSDGEVTDKYDKIGLVPFGERAPFFYVLKPAYRAIYSLFGLPAYTRLPGAFPKPLTTPDLTAAVYICYESVFPHIVREQVQRGGQVLVNITNDSWFGTGSGGEQHFLMGTMRAIETRRYILRAGNDGVTAVVNPLGQTITRLERQISSSLVGDYALMDGQTLYVRWGDWIVLLSAIYTVVVVIILVLNR